MRDKIEAITSRALYVFLGVVAGFISSANATSVLAPSQVIVADSSVFNSVSQNASPISVSGMDPVAVTLSASHGSLRITTTTGITAPPQANSAHWTGHHTLSFEGALADVNAALASLEVEDDGQTITIEAHPAYVYASPVNGHSYQLISTKKNWSAASADAQSRTIGGQSGYLATITSLAELNEIKRLLDWSDHVWLGGSDKGNEGEWFWITGPESGQQFFSKNDASLNSYSRWNAGQPSNSIGGQHHLTMNSNAYFYDQVETRTFRYIIEYSAISVVSQSFTVTTQAAIAAQQQAAAIASFQYVRNDLKLALEDIFAHQLSRHFRQNLHRLEANRYWHEQWDKAKTSDKNSMQAPKFYFSAEDRDENVAVHARSDTVFQNKEAGFQRLETAFSYGVFGHGKFSQNASVQWTRAQNLDQQTARFLRSAIEFEAAKGGYVFDFQSSDIKIHTGFGLSHRFSEALYGSVFVDSWVGWLKADYHNQLNQSAHVELRRSGVSAASQLQASYKISDRLWLDMMVSYSHARDRLRSQKIIGYGAAILSLDDLALQTPSSTRFTASPALRLELGRDDLQNLRELTFAPAIICEKYKARTVLRGCRKSYLLDFALHNLHDLAKARIYLDYDQLAQGPVHEYGVSIDVKF